MALHITTYTGIDFKPLEPKAEEIAIEDIAHSLSLLCRANGHYEEFYSVAAHCINCYDEACARAQTTRVKLACLLHDAAEAYISDIPRPVKTDLSGIDEIESRIISLVYEKFVGSPLSEYELSAVKTIDDAMLYYEFYEYKGIRLFEEMPYVASSPLFYDDTPKQVERKFLEIFRELTGEALLKENERIKLRVKGDPLPEGVKFRLHVEEPAEEAFEEDD